MIDCARCGRAYPEVVGAATQLCPHCGHEARGFLHVEEAPAARVDPAAAAGRAFRLYARKWPLLALLMVPAALARLAVNVVAATYLASTGVEPEASTGDALRLLGVGLPLLLVFLVVCLALWGPVAAVALGRPVRDAWRRAPSFLGLSAILLGLYLAGAMLLVVPFLVFLHWYLYAPAALLDGGRGIASALDASKAFARRMRTFGFTALVAFVAFVVLVVTEGANAVVSAVGDGWVLPAGLAGELVAIVLGCLLWPIVPLLPATYWALARDARPAAPAPDAPAAERSRTTKCPQCGTLIPYAATGQPVDVVCPSCGRAGKVL